MLTFEAPNRSACLIKGIMSADIDTVPNNNPSTIRPMLVNAVNQFFKGFSHNHGLTRFCLRFNRVSAMKKRSSRPAARIVAGWLAFLPLGRIATRDATYVREASHGALRPRGFREMRWQRKSGTRGAAVGMAVLLLLAGCAPHVRYIPVPCLTKDQVLPSEPEKVGPKLTGRADEDLRIVAGSAIRLRAYGQGLRGILEGCRGK